MSDSGVIKHIVLVGHHLPLMMSAAILSSQLADQPVRISAVEIKGNSHSQFESTGSEFLSLCDILKLPFKTIVQQCRGAFSLGQRYINQQHDWFVPYGHYGIQTADSEFVQGVFRLAQHYPAIQNESACIAAQAARQGKFAIPPVNRPDLHQALAFAVNLDASAYAQELKQFALAHKVTFLQADHVTATRGKNQHIESIKLDGQQNITADFWIDCSGESGCLTDDEDDIATGIIDAHWDKLAECIVEDPASIDQPFNQLQVTSWGWLKKSALTERTGVQLEYASQQVSEAEINQWLSDYLSLSVGQTEKIVHRQNQLKMRKKVWRGNCLLVGSAAVNNSKLFFSELFFVQAALIQFLGLYPSLTNQAINAHYFNHQWQQFVDEANDYVQCHYWLIEQQEGKRELMVSATLQQRLEMFQRLGRLPLANSDAVSDNAWYSLLTGMGIRPQQPSLYLSNLSNEQLHHSFIQITSSIDNLVAGMPRYRDFYQQFIRS